MAVELIKPQYHEWVWSFKLQGGMWGRYEGTPA